MGRFDIVSSWEPFTLMIKIDDMTGDGANSQTMIVVNLWQKAPDALIYSDMTPFRAFTDANPLRFGVTSFEIIVFCVVSGVAGLAVWGVAALVRRGR